jgi:transporter family-2 protein
MATTGTGEPALGATSRSLKASKPLGIALAVVAGLAVSVQGRINGQLGAELGDSMLAAVISFLGGLIVLLALLPFSPKMRKGLRNVRERVGKHAFRPWHLLAGVGGATLVTGQAITVPVIGVALFTVGVVAGQTVSGLLVDKAGIGPSGRQSLTVPRVVGALLTLAAVGGSLFGGVGGGGGARYWLLVLPVVGGVLIAIQQAFNGQVKAAAENAMTATLINFGVGLVALVLGWLVSLALRGGPTAFPPNVVLYLGGLVGIVYIGLTALVVNWIGVLLVSLAVIAGQLIGAVLLDIVVPAHGGHLATATLIGSAIALVAVAIAAVPSRSRER